MPTEQKPLELGPRPWLFASAANSLHTLDRKLMLRFRRPPRLVVILRQIREESIAQHRERKCYDAINDEQPSAAIRYASNRTAKSTYLQPARPWTPLRPVYAAACRKPLKSCPIEPASQNIMARLPSSRGVYQLPRR